MRTQVGRNTASLTAFVLTVVLVGCSFSGGSDRTSGPGTPLHELDQSAAMDLVPSGAHQLSREVSLKCVDHLENQEPTTSRRIELPEDTEDEYLRSFYVEALEKHGWQPAVNTPGAFLTMASTVAAERGSSLALIDFYRMSEREILIVGSTPEYLYCVE